MSGDAARPMDRALELAGRVMGTTSPNPAVGCVILRDGEVVAEGATEPAGSSHAEVVALRAAGERAQDATMFVTLEPCCHHGRTPPCTDAIIAAGIAKVHIAVQDPNPKVLGQGIAQLRKAGIEIAVGDGEAGARRLYEAFFTWVTTGLPFVYAKFAMSLDGKIATRTGDSRWITGEAARRKVHQMRGVVDAVMVGSTTALTDDPQLTARDEEGRPSSRQPLRIIVDSQARLAPTAKLLLHPTPVLIAVGASASEQAVRGLEAAGAEVVSLPGDGPLVDLPSLLALLGARQKTSVLVEGGGELLASLFQERLVNKVMAFIAPVLIGGKAAPSPFGGIGSATVADAPRLKDVTVERLGDDTLITGYIEVR